MKPEQASKGQVVSAEPPLIRRRLEGSSEHPTDEGDPLTGVMGTARTQTALRDVGDLHRCVAVARNRNRCGPRQESEEPIVLRKPVNAGGGKGLWFGVRLDEPRGGRLA